MAIDPNDIEAIRAQLQRLNPAPPQAPTPSVPPSISMAQTEPVRPAPRSPFAEPLGPVRSNPTTPLVGPGGPIREAPTPPFVPPQQSAPIRTAAASPYFQPPPPAAPAPAGSPNATIISPGNPRMPTYVPPANQVPPGVVTESTRPMPVPPQPMGNLRETLGSRSSIAPELRGRVQANTGPQMPPQGAPGSAVGAAPATGINPMANGAPAPQAPGMPPNMPKPAVPPAAVPQAPGPALNEQMPWLQGRPTPAAPVVNPTLQSVAGEAAGLKPSMSGPTSAIPTSGGIGLGERIGRDVASASGPITRAAKSALGGTIGNIAKAGGQMMGVGNAIQGWNMVGNDKPLAQNIEGVLRAGIGASAVAPATAAVGIPLNYAVKVADETGITQKVRDWLAGNKGDKVAVTPGGKPATLTDLAAGNVATPGQTPATPSAAPQAAPQPASALPGPAAPGVGNNVGNIRPIGASTGFQQYGTPQEGIAAVDKNLQAYHGHGINTVEGAISRWAPPSENDTASYIKHVHQILGTKPGQQIDLSNPVTRHLLGAAIMLHENGPQRLFGAAGQAPAGQASAAPGQRMPIQTAGQQAKPPLYLDDNGQPMTPVQVIKGMESSMQDYNPNSGVYEPRNPLGEMDSAGVLDLINRMGRGYATGRVGEAGALKEILSPAIHGNAQIGSAAINAAGGIGQEHVRGQAARDVAGTQGQTARAVADITNPPFKPTTETHIDDPLTGRRTTTKETGSFNSRTGQTTKPEKEPPKAISKEQFSALIKSSKGLLDTPAQQQAYLDEHNFVVQ